MYLLDNSRPMLIPNEVNSFTHTTTVTTTISLSVSKGELKRNFINLPCTWSPLNQFSSSKSIPSFSCQLLKIIERSSCDVMSSPQSCTVFWWFVTSRRDRIVFKNHIKKMGGFSKLKIGLVDSKKRS